jgi:leader peptidase (prepilin peptidase)/N-methyltransferase
MASLSAPAPPATAGRVGGRARISAVAAAPFVLACFLAFGFGARAFLAAFFVTVLVVLSVIDLAERRLPNRIVLPAVAIVLAANLALSPGRGIEWLVAALGAAAFFFVPLLVYPAGMGMGDVKLALLLGAMLGKTVLTALFVATLAAGCVAIVLLIVQGASARKQAIPFGPFLALGAIVALFAGDVVAL